ncbi:MAG: endolytic transglycosylase MltG [Parvibaculum sp.]|uniref:endolytic transglycosylase MltG n=1 Tax=Parvibaculum sp. TaxID=2024848 RepID=UPI0025E0DECE|nr:endolytic transglycosylase MltG [Parvibaculum sp.]MCE9651084.1 endolytic transglycosylase MltG [Parvibaculum sp.]
MTDAGETPEERPASAPKRRRFLGALLFASIVLPSLVVLVAGGAFLYGKWRFEAEGPLAEKTVVWLQPGLGLAGITGRLQTAGVLSEPLIFRTAVRLTGAASALKAGEYEIPAHMSMADIIRVLREGKSIVHKITIPEGLTSQQAMEIVKADPVLAGEMPLLPPEGALLPETYNFLKGTTRIELVKRMQKSQTALMNALWPKRAAGLPFSTPNEALILASIVEKETGLKSERPKVAAVFVNRLRVPMRLQSDPTIVYGITRGAGPLGRPIRRSEIDRPTPYNTYQIDGLPPTPICNPGRASIEAVLNPPATGDLYFVADGSGGHAFSPSLAGHTRNVDAWRKLDRQKKAQKPAEASPAKDVPKQP